MLNVTVLPDGFSSLPPGSNVAFTAGQAESDLVIVPAGAFTDFYNGSAGNVQMAADLEGYYTS